MSARPWVSGEWALAWEDGKNGVVAEGASGKLVCIIGNLDPNDGLEPIRKANARLISAAPDLAGALIALLDPSGFASEDEYAEAIAKAHAALAKAGVE